MNLIVILICSTIGEKNRKAMDKQLAKDTSSGYALTWMVNVALDIYLISQLSTFFGG